MKSPMAKSRPAWATAIGSTLLAISLVGMGLPFVPKIRLETAFKAKQVAESVDQTLNPVVALPASAPVLFNPLLNAKGEAIVPVNTEFTIIIPKIGVNSAVVAGVDPLKSAEYTKALKEGVAHASTSYLPTQNGTVYLFSHSTNYDWFVRDLNAVFYHLKNLTEGDLIVLVYQGRTYTYRYTSQKVVSPKDTSYLVPESGKKKLILQTCWPPGSTTERLLIFADLIDERGIQI